MPNTGFDAVASKIQHDSTFVGMLRTRSAETNIDPGLRERLDSVTEYLDRVTDVDRPFLSVLLRTQGRRLESFKDALLCLTSQTDQDFEIIVLEHDVTPADSQSVRKILERLPPEFLSRLQLIEVVGGGRAKPLNLGLAASTGRYVAVYDDDDVLFANWVESFKATSATAGGRLMRAVTANQKVSPEPWSDGRAGFRSISWPRPEYPERFDLLQHLLVNHSPFMSWAFPRALFFSYGLRFDEDLAVVEDWDLILRGSLLCGVEDVPALTAIYRRWEGGSSSYTQHSGMDWKTAEQRVINRINSSPLIMPRGAMESMRQMVLYNTALDGYRFLFAGTSLRRPFNSMWNLARPGFNFAVRLRNRLRRIRQRTGEGQGSS